LLDERQVLQLLSAQALLQEILESQGLICSPEGVVSLVDVAEDAVRSPLQIELILRSLNRSLAKPLGRASP